MGLETAAVGFGAIAITLVRKYWKDAYGISSEIVRNHNQTVKYNAEMAYLGGVLDADRVCFFGFKNSEFYIDGSHVFKLSIRADWYRRGLASTHETFSFLLTPDAFSRLVSSDLFSDKEPWVVTSSAQGLTWVDDGAGLGCSLWGMVMSGGKLKGLLMVGWNEGHKSCRVGDSPLPPGQAEEFNRVRENLSNF